MSTTVYNVDCMEYMRTVPDKFFDLAIVDPPYGGGSRERERERERDGLCGGGADFESRKRSRFGGLFDKYHICEQDGRNVGGEVQPPRGCL